MQAARIAVGLGARASLAATVRRCLFGISPDEVRFARRGFPSDIAGIRERLERAGLAFVSGYHAALDRRGDLLRLSEALGEVEPDLCGFAHEGAGMGLALVDLLTRGKRWREMFVAAPRHSYLLLVGAGWAMARLRLRSLPRFARDLDDASWPLLWDGFGFHQGFFHHDRFVRRHERPRLRGYALRAFDQGLGRSLWFVDGASPPRLTSTIATFDPARRADLWSGVGLACGYAGGVDADAIVTLRDAAEAARGAFAQGVIFAAAARERAGNSDAATSLACEVVCGIDPPGAAALADAALVDSKAIGSMPSYEDWRGRIASQFAKEVSCA